jgi:hypothetical protein
MHALLFSLLQLRSFVAVHGELQRASQRQAVADQYQQLVGTDTAATAGGHNTILG